MKKFLSILFLFLLPVIALSDTGSITASATPVFAPGQSISHGFYDLLTYTPTADCTFTGDATGAVAGRRSVLKITTSGTSTFVVTFGTNMSSIGTLVTGTTTAITYIVEFIYDGTNFVETNRQRLGSPIVAVPVVATTSTLPYAEGAMYTFASSAATVNLAIDKVGRAGAVIYLRCIYSSAQASTITFTTNVKTAKVFVNTGFTAVDATMLTGTSTYLDTYATLVSDGTNWRVISGTELMVP